MFFGKNIEIPKEWKYGSLEQKINILSGFAFNSKKFSKEKGLPLIRIRDLTNSQTETLFDGNFSEEYLVNSGDLLVGMDGDFSPHLWNGSRALLNQRVCKITTSNHNVLVQNFIYHVIKKPLRHYESTISGTTVIHISKKDIENILIPIPTITEQTKIASILSGVDAKSRQHKR